MLLSSIKAFHYHPESESKAPAIEMSALLSIKHCYNQSRVEGAKSNGEERRLVRSEIDLTVILSLDSTAAA